VPVALTLGESGVHELIAVRHAPLIVDPVSVPIGLHVGHLES